MERLLHSCLHQSIDGSGTMPCFFFFGELVNNNALIILLTRASYD